VSNISGRSWILGGIK
ncbi:unnamed protein product, partial [Callosobruchus maculatus]